MADRFSLVMQLNALSTEAAQRGDDRAAATLEEAARMLFADRTVDKRRKYDRTRKKEEREVHRIPVESGGVRGQADAAPSEVSPLASPLPNSPDNNNTARGALAAKLDDLTEMHRGNLSGQMGPLFDDANDFVQRRPSETWAAWFKEMLSWLAGGKALPDDIAQVCRDDAALTRPVASPKGFRVFMRSAIEERLTPPSGAGTTGNGDGGARREQKSSHPEHWKDKQAREEREEGTRQSIRIRSGNVEQRRAKDDGEAWWARMQREAVIARVHPVLYAYDHMTESEAAHV